MVMCYKHVVYDASNRVPMQEPLPLENHNIVLLSGRRIRISHIAYLSFLHVETNGANAYSIIFLYDRVVMDCHRRLQHRILIPTCTTLKLHEIA